MPRGVADVVQVVMLATGTNTFLGGGGSLVRPLFQAGEDVLELHHARVGEHQGRVIARNQRGRRHDLVAVIGKEFEKSRPDFVNAAHVSPITKTPGNSPNRRHFSRAPLVDKGDGGVQKVYRGSEACRSRASTPM